MLANRPYGLSVCSFIDEGQSVIRFDDILKDKNRFIPWGVALVEQKTDALVGINFLQKDDV